MPLAINTTPVLRHSVHSMTFAMSNNCVYLPFRKNCCKSGRKRDLTKTKPRNVFGFCMCEFFVSICTAMAMMLHVHSPPAPHVNKCFVPYIFTKDEIERLFSAVDCTKESSESPLRHLVMPVLFRLLYTCGLRVSEALHLKVADVDLDAGVLAIYGAKGDKERLVGISDSMLTYMKSYRSNPLVANAKSIYFFPAPDGGFYDTSTIYDIFRKCLFDAGIPHRGRGKGPRLHDLRHSFAVHILNKWSSEGKDIYTCLPILRTALGHDRITTTEKYLRLVPEAYMEVTEPFNDRFHTITEVLCNEE